MLNIVLTGFMGAGKSLMAETLSRLTGRKAVSLDQLIVDREGMSINEIFDDKGEQYFRILEKQIVSEAAQMDNVIIDCGGGVVLDPDNMKNLKATGRVFYLSATPREIYDRIKDEGHRPLLKTPDPAARIESLLEKRLPYYQKADYTIETDGRSPEEIARDIVDIMDRDSKTA